jgi:hypothetical protein
MPPRGRAPRGRERAKLGRPHYHRRAVVLRPANQRASRGRRAAPSGHFVSATGFFEVICWSAPAAGRSIRLNARRRRRCVDRARGLVPRTSSTSAKGAARQGSVVAEPVGGAQVSRSSFERRRCRVALRQASDPHEAEGLRSPACVVSFEPALIGLQTVRAWFATLILIVRVNDDFLIVAKYAHSWSEFDSAGSWVGNDLGSIGA